MHGEAQDAVDEVEAKPTQHALAEPSLEGIDVELESAVDADEGEEQEAQPDEIRQPLELDAREQCVFPAAEKVGKREFQLQEPSGGPRHDDAVLDEAFAVDRTVDDDLRQVEGKKIERQRGQDHEQNPNLILARVLPDVPEEPGFHALTRVSCSAGGEQFTAATGSGINC